MQSLSQIKSLLESRGLSPKRSLGQNFLVDQNLLRKLIDSAAPEPGDLILEVGPGTGVLTEALLAHGCRVVACELDDSLAAMLRERGDAGEFPGADRLTVVHADCLESKGELSSDLQRAMMAHAPAGAPPRFRLIANLPYGCATTLIITLLLKHPSCDTLAVTIQNEVSDRLLAPPRTPERGMLSLIAQTFAEVERIATLPRECFWPRPDVTSAMVLLRRRASLPFDPRRTPEFADFCKRLFAQRRKQLGGVLGRETRWPSGTGPTSRAEELTLAQVHELFHNQIPTRPPDPSCGSL